MQFLTAPAFRQVHLIPSSVDARHCAYPLNP